MLAGGQLSRDSGLFTRYVSLFGQLIDPLYGRVKDRVGVERRKVFVLHFVCGVEEREGHLKEIQGRELCDQPAGVGSSFALAGVGVDLAPGAASEGKLTSLVTGGKSPEGSVTIPIWE